MGLDNPLHIAFLLVILLLVFGAKRLPEMGRSLGSGLRGFKETISGEDAVEPRSPLRRRRRPPARRGPRADGHPGRLSPLANRLSRATRADP